MMSSGILCFLLIAAQLILGLCSLAYMVLAVNRKNWAKGCYFLV